MRKGDAYTIYFAAVVCVVCSLLLAGATTMLKKRQDAMVELDRKMNVLKALGVPLRDAQERGIGEKGVNLLFAEHIAETNVASAADGAVSHPLYLWRENGVVTKYALPISGKGLWSTIYGYLALDRDLATIVGITFYRHGETPGLGGEIDKDWFQDQFKGKKVFGEGRPLRFEIVKGKVSDKYPQGSDHAVDGISGATLTGNGVMRFLNSDLEQYEKYFEQQRAGMRHGG